MARELKTVSGQTEQWQTLDRLVLEAQQRTPAGRVTRSSFLWMLVKAYVAPEAPPPPPAPESP